MTVTAIQAHTGTALPLRLRDVDTDQIIPAEFCKRLGRTGYADTLFYRWRQQPRFVLNDPRFRGASVLVAGAGFGIGSSREHAVWALRDYGFRALIAPGFGDILRTNAGKNRIVTAQVSERSVLRLWERVERAPGLALTVDLVRRVIVADGLTIRFEIDEYVRSQLINGLDDINLTLRRAEAIEEFERLRPGWRPRFQ